MEKRIISLAIFLLVAACTTSTTNSPSSTAAPAQTATQAPQAAFVGPHGFDLTGMDTSVKACDDFYRFSVGKWREANPLPADYSRYGRFEQLAERNRDVLRKILEEDAAMASAAPGTPQQKLGDFYSACMNQA